MFGQVKRMPQPNTGIKCKVNTCRYYGTGDHCHAEQIEVQCPNNQNAQSSEMTDCATFMPQA